LKCDKKRVTKILIPLDGSKNSFRGIEMAISVAMQIGAILAVTFKSTQSKNEKFNLKVIGFMGRDSIKECFLEVYQNMLFIPPKFPY